MGCIRRCELDKSFETEDIKTFRLLHHSTFVKIEKVVKYFYYVRGNSIKVKNHTF